MGEGSLVLRGAISAGTLLLVLDEPTFALDTLSERHFVEALGRLRGNRTTFVIAHRLSTVRQAGRILVLERGHLIASGTHDHLLRACPLYATLAGEFTRRHDRSPRRRRVTHPDRVILHPITR